MPSLPIDRRNRLWFATAVGFGAVGLYGWVGKASAELNPRVLPLSPIDSWLGFVPWTFWIYATVYLIYATASILQTDLRRFQTFLYAYVIANLLSSIVFLIFPTTFPRELFPLAAGSDGDWSAKALSWFRTVDRPTNCFPSMHVGCAVISTLSFQRTSPVRFLLFALWALSIGVATLTTKQHYFVDVLGGATLGIFSFYLAERGLEER